MRAAFLAFLMAFPALAEPRTVLEVRKGSLELVDGRALEVAGGAYLDPPSLLATGKELAELRARNKALEEAPIVTPASLAIVGGICLVLGIATGAYVAVKLK